MLVLALVCGGGSGPSLLVWHCGWPVDLVGPLWMGGYLRGPMVWGNCVKTQLPCTFRYALLRRPCRKLLLSLVLIDCQMVTVVLFASVHILCIRQSPLLLFLLLQNIYKSKKIIKMM